MHRDVPDPLQQPGRWAWSGARPGQRWVDGAWDDVGAAVATEEVPAVREADATGAGVRVAEPAGSSGTVAADAPSVESVGSEPLEVGTDGGASSMVARPYSGAGGAGAAPGPAPHTTTSAATMPRTSTTAAATDEGRPGTAR